MTESGSSVLRGIKALVAAIAGWFCIALPAGADTLNEVLSRGELIVGTGSANAPWHFKNEDDELVGFDIEIARILANGLFGDPDKVRFVTQAADARIPNLVTGKVDIVCQFMTVTAGRAQQVNFTRPYYREGVGLIVLEGAELGDYAALQAAGDEVRVGVLQNVYAEKTVHKALPEAKVDQYDSPNLVSQALNARRVDAAVMDASTIRYLAAQNPDRYAYAGKAWGPQSYSCAVRRGDADWLHYVDTALREAMLGVDFDAYADAFEKWFGIRPDEPEIGFPQEYK
ncbi:MAG: transporter substrate-binding domain-containing protein [Henriciella sp.]|nr:transporter substrate-binding domain-containing protein [Henriciella sp.]